MEFCERFFQIVNMIKCKLMAKKTEFLHREAHPLSFIKVFAVLIVIQLATTSSIVVWGATESKGGNVLYRYERSDMDTSKLIKSIELVKLGDTVAQVKAILGEPTEERDLVGKKGEFNSRLLRYYIKRVDPELVNISDKYISLYFNARGGLISIEQNINPNMLPVKKK